MEDTKDKSRRILDIYASLVDGKTVYKKELAQKYEVNERTIQRDFDDVRDFSNNTSSTASDNSYFLKRLIRSNHGR